MKFRIMIFTILISLIGVLMVYSSSFVWAEYKMNNEYYYLVRQAIFFLIGVGIMFVISRIDYHLYKKYATLIFLIAVGLLIIVLIPNVGIVRGGARSWIGFGNLTFQPSEFMKLGLVILLSKYLSNNINDLNRLKNFILIMLVIILVFGLIMLEPDFGSGIVIVLSSFAILFIRGIKKRWFITISILGIGFMGFLIVLAPYRLDRITSYLDPWSDPLGSGFQTIQALYALSPGGLFGLGLFRSRQKFFYLPEPQTDFIFAIITEELGLVGSIVIIIIFIYIIYTGYLIALNAKDKFGFYLASGLITTVFVQFFINISVVIGLLPVTGITLPFLSYGGSSLLINFLMIGIICNISNHTID